MTERLGLPWWIRAVVFCIFCAQTAVIHAHVLTPSIMSVQALPDGSWSMTVDASVDLLNQWTAQGSQSDKSLPADPQHADVLIKTMPDPQTFAKRLAELLIFRTEGDDRADVRVELQNVFTHGESDKSMLADFKFVYAVRFRSETQKVRVVWPASMGDAVLMVGDGKDQAPSLWLKGGEVSAFISLTQPTQQSFLYFVGIGFEHILPGGMDHILFVIGLYLFSTRLKPLLLQVSAFTLAHTCTLFLATLGIISVNARIVEPIIALSIAYIATENIRHGALTRWRLLVVFCFGLLHGLGFAGALSEVGIKSATLFRDLIAFNVGIEMGQLVVVLTMHVTFGYWLSKLAFWKKGVKVPLSLLIAATGVFWFLQRI